MSSQHDPLNALRQNFPLFVVKAFNIVNPGQDLIPTAALGAMAHRLSEVAQGRCRRLVLNVPPRSGKSLLASVALPAYMLGRDPSRRIICASYSGELTGKLSRDCRAVMQHPSYRQLFPATQITGKNTETEIETAHGGFRYATSVGGTLTGRGGNLIIIDDPLKPDEAMSAVGRDRVWEWFTGTVGSRLDNKAEDAIVVVMQRLHVDDLSGRLLEHGGWEHLAIPAIAEHEQALTVAPGRTRLRRPGDILDPEREPLEVLDGLRRQLGAANFAAQYQQQPVPPEGALVKRQWIRTYEQSPLGKPGYSLVQSWDCAYKDGEHNDFSVCTVWLVRHDHEEAYLIDVWRDRVDYPALVKKVLELRTSFGADLILVEDAGSGTSLIQTLNERHCPVCGIKATGDKVTRMSIGSVLIEAGRVLFPAKRTPPLDDFLAELLAFPHGAHDDQVDSTSQFLGWLNDRRRASQTCVGIIKNGKFHPVYANTRLRQVF
jgi:predicted phage terminase large subunit-like protein